GRIRLTGNSRVCKYWRGPDRRPEHRLVVATGAARPPGRDANASTPRRSTGGEHTRPGGNVQVTPSSSAPGTGSSCPQQRRPRKSGSIELHLHTVESYS